MYRMYKMYKMLDDRIVFLVNDAIKGEAEFRKASEDVLDVFHIFVDDEYRGQGIANTFMDLLVKYCEMYDYKMKCSCPYAKEWMEKHGKETV